MLGLSLQQPADRLGSTGGDGQTCIPGVLRSHVSGAVVVEEAPGPDHADLGVGQARATSVVLPSHTLRAVSSSASGRSASGAAYVLRRSGLQVAHARPSPTPPTTLSLWRRPRGGSTSRLLPSAKTRATIAKRLSAQTSAMTTATIAEMEARHHWFRDLDAEHRSWITLVARAGIDGFVELVRRSGPGRPTTSDVFGSAPRELARKITLHQTVELVTHHDRRGGDPDRRGDAARRPTDPARGDRAVQPRGGLRRRRDLRPGGRAARHLGRPAGGVGGRCGAARRDRRDRAVPGLDAGLALDDHGGRGGRGRPEVDAERRARGRSGTRPRSPVWTCSARCRATG